MLQLLHPLLPVVPASPHGSTVSFSSPPYIPKTSCAHLRLCCPGWVDGKGPVISCKSCFSQIRLGGAELFRLAEEDPITGLSGGVKHCPGGRCCLLNINSVCSLCQRAFKYQTCNARGPVIAGGSRPPRNSYGEE